MKFFKIAEKMVFWFIIVFGSLYILVLSILYFNQEKLIFFPDILPKDYTFKFDGKYEEKFIETPDHKILNGLLFKADSSRGLVFYLHGNAGAIDSWGFASNLYNGMNFDFFAFDYRGYGKSEGKIENEEQMYEDVQLAYTTIAREYNENQIIIIGQSIGTGPAAKLAAQNNPKMMILISPYYSLTYLVKQKYRIVPEFLLRYKFPTNEFIKKVKAPIVLFHGNKDKVINMDSSIKLKKICKSNDQLIILENIEHNGIQDNVQFQNKIGEILQ